MLFKKDKVVPTSVVPGHDYVDSMSSKQSEEPFPTWAVWVISGLVVAAVVGLIVTCVYCPSILAAILKMPMFIH